MTRTDGKDSLKTGKDQDPPIGQVLQVAVGQALEQGRLICGVHDCAQLLEIDPFNAMMCVLPEATESPTDVSAQIYHMLIEAFCREYDIRLVKVDSLPKLAKIVNSHSTMDNGVPMKRSVTESDVNCLLLQYPQHAPSVEDEGIAEYYKSCLFTDDPHAPVIELPD